MATVTYINNDYETLAEALQQLVDMGYFESVEYDSDTDTVVCYDGDENAIFSIGKKSGGTRDAFTVSLLMDDGTTVTKDITAAGSTAGSITPSYVYICSGGMYLSAGTSTAAHGYVLLSKTNNGTLGMIVPSGAVTASMRLSPNCIATDDAADQIGTAFAFAVPTLRNQTVLTDVPTCSAPTVVSVFPDIRYTLTSQFSYTSETATPPINFSQDGKRYLWVGYFAVRDEEA